MKKILAIGSTMAVLASSLAFAVPQVSAATFSVGNDIAARTQVDTFHNFTIVDTNHPSPSSGQLTSFNYYASNTNSFRFVLVDASSIVRWVSVLITPSSVGVHTFTPGSPVTISAGWNIGMYFASMGTIPFEFTGSPAWYTANNSGLPTVGMILSYIGSSGRTYSFVATGTTNSGHEEGNENEDENEISEGHHGGHDDSDNSTIDQGSNSDDISEHLRNTFNDNSSENSLRDITNRMFEND
ncbi:MAG: hypothetical protein V1845_02495 [bacterium]